MQPVQPTALLGFSGEARLFPLPNVVVFPHSLNPLRVFESRYIEMFQESLGDDQLIAMATLLPGYEPDYYGRPPIASTVCMGQVAKHRRCDDGTYEFLLVGLQRARIEDEITPVRSYRRAVVELLPEEEISEENEVLALGDALLAKASVSRPQFQDLLSPFQTGEISLSTMTDAVAHHAELDLKSKIALLQELNSVSRAKLLLELLPQGDARRRLGGGFSEN